MPNTQEPRKRKFKDLVKSLGLTSKQEIAILELTEAGLLGPLLEDLKNSIETPQSQSSTETSEKVLDPITQDLVDQGLSPEEAEEFLQGT
ncbi:MAG: hypothetical protein HOC18_01895 [Candidatus Marinimicrobia bacterium]|jgi:hypothetical protein|nr:hypothetical protein [Candidatus Neomarinimicrobiota bacterium]